RLNGTTYSKFMNALKEKGVVINRKILASMAVENPSAFAKLTKFATK
ncbi:MAG: 50S ribosomal protein L20, partial [Ignavibacteriaceae bacterium]|nr:50S ribosomal protein L20 [Ignavibacteriaceae bacterium]